MLGCAVLGALPTAAAPMGVALLHSRIMIVVGSDEALSITDA
jgi:hypothetical protein